MTHRVPGTIPQHLSDAETIGAWAVFGVTGAIQSQHNVASVTDNGVGDWTVNWAIQFAATTYAMAGCTRDQTSGAVGSILGILHAGGGETITTSSARVRTGNSTGAARDPTDGIYVLAIGRR